LLYSVCILTYKRQELLRKCINSILIQKEIENIDVEIIIIDNDKEAGAKTIVDELANHSKFLLKYFVQPVKNISLARNLAIEKANGDYILFIDDDEIADEKWIFNLVKTVRIYNADVVMGRVESYFDENAPTWIQKCFLYNRRRYNTGTDAFEARSGNCILSNLCLMKIDGLFDPRYGLTGGEDTNFFQKLRHLGVKMVNCDEAITKEYIPLERTKICWLMKRALRTGNSYSRCLIEFAEKPRYSIRINQIAIGTSYMLISIVLLIIFLPFSNKRLHWALKSAANFGKIMAGFNNYFYEYK
jgi:succinoglycan biosynthesis protein ExoM